MRLEAALAATDLEVVTLDSPLGGALLGAKAGDVVEIEAPKRSWKARHAVADLQVTVPGQELLRTRDPTVVVPFRHPGIA